MGPKIIPVIAHYTGTVFMKRSTTQGRMSLQFVILGIFGPTTEKKEILNKKPVSSGTSALHFTQPLLEEILGNV